MALVANHKTYFNEQGTLDSENGPVIAAGYLEGPRYFRDNHYFNVVGNNVPDTKVCFDEALYFQCGRMV